MTSSQLTRSFWVIMISVSSSGDIHVVLISFRARSDENHCVTISGWKPIGVPTTGFEATHGVRWPRDPRKEESGREGKYHLCINLTPECCLLLLVNTECYPGTCSGAGWDPLCWQSPILMSISLWGKVTSCPLLSWDSISLYCLRSTLIPFIQIVSLIMYPASLKDWPSPEGWVKTSSSLSHHRN